MAKQVLFIQGGGAGAHDEWDTKLVASLERELGPGYEIRYPLMPNESDPHYAAWSKAIENEIAALADGAIVVGHSIGATILLSTLAARPPKRKLKAVVLLAAPFVGDGGWPSDELPPMQGLGGKLPAGADVYLFHGSADETAPPFHADLYAKAIPKAHVRKLEGRDHQLNNDMRGRRRDQVARRGMTMADASTPLKALSLIAAGDWDGAHKLVQDDESAAAAWVHAHLHRIEGDLDNAAYWYRTAGKPLATGDLTDERHAIEKALKRV